MRPRVSVVLLAFLAACAGETAATTTSSLPTTTESTAATTTEGPTTTEAGTTTSTGATTTAPAAGAAQFVLTEIAFGEAGMVVITNVGGETGSLVGHFLCQQPTYFRIPDVDLEPGQSLALSTGGDAFTPPEGAITVEETAAVGGLRATGGEIGLYSLADFANPDVILSYVEWGSAEHGRSGTAVDAGVWDGGFVATSDATAAITAATTPAFSADDWTSG